MHINNELLITLFPDNQLFLFAFIGLNNALVFCSAIISFVFSYIFISLAKIILGIACLQNEIIVCLRLSFVVTLAKTRFQFCC